MNTGLQELLSILRGKRFGGGNGGAVTDSGLEDIVELADLALFL